MINLSDNAERQIRALLDHYAKLERPEASRSLIAAIDQAIERIEHNPRRGLPAPRPYPSLGRRGELWAKAGRYWLAYSTTTPPVILGVFHDSADIPGRF